MTMELEMNCGTEIVYKRGRTSLRDIHVFNITDKRRVGTLTMSQEEAWLAQGCTIGEGALRIEINALPKVSEFLQAVPAAEEELKEAK